MNTTLLTTTTKCAQGWILMETRARRLGNVGWISCGFCTRRVQTNVGWNISYVWFGNYVSLPVDGTDYSLKLMAIPVVVVAAVLLPPLHHTVVIQPPLTKRHLNPCTLCDEKRYGPQLLRCVGANRVRCGILSDIERHNEVCTVVRAKAMVGWY